MIATILILSTTLLSQAQAPGVVPKGNETSAPKGDEAPVAKAPSRAERAQLEREAAIAKRKAARPSKAQAQAILRARAAQEEAKIRDYELKMAPLIAAQQVEMAKIRAQEQQAALNQQAVTSAQQFQSARIAQENLRLQLEYYRSQQPIQVIIRP